jgi:redox-sensitive bicupin YhaK (pirin superfamily)
VPTAGRGITRSERTPEEVRRHDSRIFGVQLWVGLPKAHEETAPAFHHHDAAALPELEAKGLRLKVIAGNIGATRSPVATFAATLCADAEMAAGTTLALPAEHEERSLYVLSGAVEIGGHRVEPGRLLVFRPGGEVAIHAPVATRLLLLGGRRWMGRAMSGGISSPAPRSASSRPRPIGRPAASRVIDETEFIPLPD